MLIYNTNVTKLEVDMYVCGWGQRHKLRGSENLLNAVLEVFLPPTQVLPRVPRKYLHKPAYIINR